MPCGPSSRMVAPGSAVSTGEWVAITTWAPAARSTPPAGPAGSAWRRRRAAPRARPSDRSRHPANFELQQVEEALAVAAFVQAWCRGPAGARSCSPDRCRARAWFRRAGNRRSRCRQRRGSRAAPSPSGDSLARVECMAPRDPPSGLIPYARASASTSVDFPDPFSPTRKVMPAGRSRPDFSTLATAGMRAHQAARSTVASGRGSTRRIGRESNSLARTAASCHVHSPPVSTLRTAT